MSAQITVLLDTSPPPSPALSIVDDSGRLLPTTAVRDVLARVLTAGAPPAQTDEVKLWGDVDPSASGLLGTDEQSATWASWVSLASNGPLPVRLADGPAGQRRLYARVRDSLHNQAQVVSAVCVYDPAFPTADIWSGPDRSLVSLQPGFSLSSFSWKPNVDVSQYQVRVVPRPDSSHSSGFLIGTGNGSSGVSGGPVAAGQVVPVAIAAADLLASSPGDGAKIVKVFARTAAGVWSL